MLQLYEDSTVFLRLDHPGLACGQEGVTDCVAASFQRVRINGDPLNFQIDEGSSLREERAESSKGDQVCYPKKNQRSSLSTGEIFHQAWLCSGIYHNVVLSQGAV
jgi:hypothetical protein